MKAYIKGLVIRFGPIQVSGSIFPTKATDDGPKFKVCSPDGQAVKQKYVTEDGQSFTQGELHKAIEEEDGTLTYVGKDNVKEAKTSSLPKNVLNVTPISSQGGLDKFLCPADNQPYVFVPDEHDPANVQWYDLMHTMVSESGSVFVCMANIKGLENMYRLRIIQDHIAVERVLLPEEVNQFDTRKPNVDDAVRAKALNIVSAKTEEFDPQKFTSETRHALKKLAEGTYEPDLDAASNKPTAGTIDLMAALEGFDL